MARVTSNRPFNRQANVRKGAGPVYNVVKTQTPSVNEAKEVKKLLPTCFGEYDNLVAYVFEYDTQGHLAYVDCDYVE